MFTIPLALSLGESYIRGDYDFDGDPWVAAPAILAYLEAVHTPADAARIYRLWRTLPKDHAARTPVDTANITAETGSKQWDLEGIRYHYDAGNDFYRLYLDERMVYSCAYYPTGTEDLDTAQELKLDLICRKLRLKPGERLLDIGCGWGALVIFAAQRYGVTALGVTLSKEQHALATERVAEAGLQDRVTIRLQDYRDLKGEQFDKLASVGMFEHVGFARLPEYFAHTFSLLRPGGLFLNHGISGWPRPGAGIKRKISRKMYERLVGTVEFRKRYIFPTGGLVAVSEANLAAEQAGFEVRDVEDLREHYARTLVLWMRKLDSNRDAAVKLVGMATYRLRRIWLGVAAWQFMAGDTGVHQTLLAKKDNGKANVPWSREDIYLRGNHDNPGTS
ncbi:MAG TPA: cyclopropane-fatty-acyl-phospholipid synthase family protein [Gemmatimonadaceae bacterium]